MRRLKLSIYEVVTPGGGGGGGGEGGEGGGGEGGEGGGGEVVTVPSCYCMYSIPFIFVCV
jgi:hypothetical protein